MLKQFARDTVIYGASNLLTRGIGLLLLPLYTRVLTPGEYGTVDYLQVVRGFLALTLALEIVQALVRFLPEARSEAEKRVLASTALWFTAGAYGVFAVAGLLWAGPLSRLLLGVPDAAGAFRVAVLYMAAAGVLTPMHEMLRFEFRPGDYAAASVLNAAVVAGVTAALLLATPLRTAAVFLGLLAGSLAAGAYCWRASRHRFGLVFRWRTCGEMLAFSLPLVASGVAVFFSMFVDRIVIRELMSLAAVGLYGVAFRFASATSLLVVVLQSALTPLIYNRWREEGTPAEIARILRLVAAVLVPAVVLLGVFGPELVALVATPEYLPAAPVIPVLASSVVLSQFWVFAPGLGLAKRTGTIAGLNVAGAVANTVLNLLLVPRLGLMGAALATLAGAAFTAAGYLLLGSRHYRVPHAWPRLLAAAGVGAAVLGAAPAVWGAAPAQGGPEWLGKLALSAAACAVIAGLLVRRDEVARVAARVAGRGGPG